MKSGTPLKQDPGWYPEGSPAQGTHKVPFHGPFRFITACLEKTGRGRKNQWCLMFVNDSSMIIMPVPQDTPEGDLQGTGHANEQKPAHPILHGWFRRDRDSEMFGQLDNLVSRYRDADPATVFVADNNAESIPLETIKEIAITRVRSFGRYSHILFIFGLYPAEPANARYDVNFQLEITTGKMIYLVTTPFSFELKQTLRDLLGERVHEIPDEYAPLL
jgi:hypothetical protein